RVVLFTNHAVRREPSAKTADDKSLASPVGLRHRFRRRGHMRFCLPRNLAEMILRDLPRAPREVDGVLQILGETHGQKVKGKSKGRNWVRFVVAGESCQLLVASCQKELGLKY